jgi:hypothetical protein
MKARGLIQEYFVTWKQLMRGFTKNEDKILKLIEIKKI